MGTTSLQFWMLILATTIPIPAGYFLPIFVYGETGVLRVLEGLGVWDMTSGIISLPKWCWAWGRDEGPRDQVGMIPSFTLNLWQEPPLGASLGRS